MALVAGCGKACEIAEQEYMENAKKVKALKKILIEMLNDSGVAFKFNGVQKYCVDSTANICFPGVMSEALMLSCKQYCGISNGSACTSKNYSPSYVLEAMGVPLEEIENSVRISWGADIQSEEFHENIEQLLTIVKSFVF